MTSSISLEPLFLAGVPFDIDKNNQLVYLPPKSPRPEKSENNDTLLPPPEQPASRHLSTPKKSSVFHDALQAQPDFDWKAFLPQVLKCMSLFDFQSILYAYYINISF